MASVYNVTIKLYQHHEIEIERVTHALDIINVLNVFCSCYSLFQLLAKHSLAVLPCKQFVNKNL